MAINNIWNNLVYINQEYILEQDKIFVNTFNNYINNEDYQFNLKVVPEPRLGNIDCKVFILSGNPNIKGNSKISMQDRLSSLKNHNSPHLCLANENDGDWWRLRFKEWKNILINKLANISTKEEAFKKLSEVICTLEFCPYSSSKSGFNNLRLPSQEYQREIVLNAIKNNASFVITRNYYNWIGLVPELYGYDKVYHLSSSQCSHFSKKNILNSEEFQEKLKKEKHIDKIRDKRKGNYNPIIEILENAKVI